MTKQTQSTKMQRNLSLKFSSLFGCKEMFGRSEARSGTAPEGKNLFVYEKKQLFSHEFFFINFPKYFSLFIPSGLLMEINLPFCSNIIYFYSIGIFFYRFFKRCRNCSDENWFKDKTSWTKMQIHSRCIGHQGFDVEFGLVLIIPVVMKIKSAK